MSTVTSIDVARRLASVEGAKRIELAQWEFADALVHDFPPEQYPNEGAGHSNGLNPALRLHSETMAREGLSYSPSSLKQYRGTSLAWSKDTRVTFGAGFTVHRELRGRDDRVELLGRLIKQHGGKVTQKQVRTWKREQQPQKFRSWSDQMRARIKAVAKQAETSGAREEMAGLLMAAAQELLNG